MAIKTDLAKYGKKPNAIINHFPIESATRTRFNEKTWESEVYWWRAALGRSVITQRLSTKKRATR